MSKLKREKIELIKNPSEVNEGAEPEIERVWTIPFISFGTTREAVSLYQGLVEDTEESDDEKNDKIIDFLTEKAFGGKITKDDFNNRLPGPGYNDGMNAQETLTHLLLFVADGQQTDDTKKLPSGREVTPQSLIESMDKFARDLMKEGKDINEILEMPVHYVMQILEEKVEVKQANSFFDLLG